MVKFLVSATLVVTLISGLIGCTPTRFRVRPERDDAAAAQAAAERAAAICAERRNNVDLPPYPFTSDGCSSWPDGNWVDCCRAHDIAYWCGGSAAAREQADADLRSCVAQHDSACMGEMMYLGVRIGGIPWQPFPWRWGYGWSGVRGYDDGPP